MQLLILLKCNQSEFNVCSPLLVFQRYKSYSPYDMQESIMKEVKGDLQKSFLVIGEHLSAILMKLFVKYLILNILVCFPSPVYWKQTAVLCQKTEWSHEGAYTVVFIFKWGCSSKNEPSGDPSLTPQGKGAKEKLLTRIIVSRCEVDLKKVCSEYKAHFGESLQKAIQVFNLWNSIL